MPAMADSMESASGLQEGIPRMEEKAAGWATPAVIGLIAFAAVTILFGLTELPHPYCVGFWTAGACFTGTPSLLAGFGEIVGGLILGIIGLVSLRKGNLFAGSAFLAYAAFFFAFSVTGTYLGGYGAAAIAIIWVLISLTFLINSLKHGWIVFIMFLLLTVQFILLAVLWWQTGAANKVAASEHWAIGGEIILAGLVMWYLATADLTNWNYGRKLLPT
jgi:uncharacterized protein